MYKNNTVNIQNGTPDTEYIDEFLSSFLLSFPGGWRGPSPGSVHSSYIHGHAWLSDWGVSVGAEGRVCSWTLLPEDPFPAGGGGGERAWGLGWGSPSMTGKTNIHPPLGTAPSGGRGGAVAPSPRPTTFPSPCPVWDGGEVANRFPGQHRGRLGWSAGLQSGGEGRSYAAHSHPISLGLSPAQPKAAPFGPTDLPAPL